jgi:hypothetical protein
MKVNEYIKALFVLVLLALAGSCEDYLGPTVDCDDCWGYKPDSADLIINLTIDSKHPEVPIVVYRGNVESGEVDWIDTARETPYYLYAAVEQYYSVKAEYKVDGKTIMAVDGDEMKAKNATSSCDWVCWIVVDGEFKVDLK